MKMHELKTINPYFQDVWNRTKTFEIRKNDREFEEGDFLWLREYVPRDNSYTGRELTCLVKYLLTSERFEGLTRGYCAMSIVVIQKKEQCR
jgi:hypothetical protein